jgi:signal transduction histidine kinase
MLRLIDYFIKQDLKHPPYVYFKARSLVALHILLIVFSVFVMIVTTVFRLNNDVLLFPSTVIIVGLVFYFKVKGNFVISANLLCAVIFTAFSTSTFSSGGLFSDNCIWLISVPLLALLFGEKKSGVFWLALCIFFLFYLFQSYHLGEGEPKKFEPNPVYYLLSYSFLFGMIYLIAQVFKSEQYYVVNSLLNQNELLEQKNNEIEVQNQTILEAQHKLKLTNAELEQFAYVASHDLKEPLRMITMYTQMMHRRLKPHIEGDTQEFMDFITDGTRRMQHLLDDLLDYSRLGKKGNTNVVDLNDVLLVVQQNLKIQISNNEAEIEICTLPKINAVFSEITQLFQNLISNALKFRNPDVSPLLKIAIKTLDKQRFVIEISDNGIGMEQDLTHKIFNLFERLHNRNDYEGTGIGLATCKKVMEHLGGNITVQSKLGVGSSFFLEFPSSALSK